MGARRERQDEHCDDAEGREWLRRLGSEIERAEGGDAERGDRRVGLEERDGGAERLARRRRGDACLGADVVRCRADRTDDLGAAASIPP